MSEENLQKVDDKTGKNAPASGGQDVEQIEVVFNKGTNEVVIRDPTTGKVFQIKATVIEPEEDEEEYEPLTPEQFSDALKRMDALGLTWTADRVPRVRAKEPTGEDALVSDEFLKIEEQYPSLPHELSVVVSYALTGNKSLSGDVGGDEVLEKKAEIANGVLITADFRSEFFFKHALKVPYLAGIDWEVVFKLEERNVIDMPAVSYALMSLLFHDEHAEIEKHRTITIAADIVLINRVIGIFTEVKSALERGHQLTERLHKSARKEKKDAPADQA